MLKKLTFISFATLIIFVSFFVYKNQQVVHAQVGYSCAQGSTLLTGHAWSSNIGWIHFSGGNYGVCMAANGDLSGYAWANPQDSSAGTDNIGWLSFNSADTSGCATSPCQANVNLSTGTVTGWARFITTTKTDAGWDGFVRLAGTWSNGVTIGAPDGNGDRSFAGYAWGGQVVGWVHFCGTNYCVSTKPVSDLAVSCSTSVSGPDGNNKYDVTWTASPTGGSGTYSTYAWTGDIGGSSNPITRKYDAGTYNGTITVTDSLGAQASGSCSAQAGGAPPSTPVLQASPGCTNVNLSWPPNPAGDNVTSYTLKRGSQAIYTDTSPFTYFYNDTGLQSNHLYTYSLFATNSNGDSTSNVVPVTTQSSCQGGNIATFVASPPIINKGSICTLQLTVNPGNDTCTISGGTVYDSNGDPANQINTTPNTTFIRTTDTLNNSTTYTLTCGNAPTKTATCLISPNYIEF